MKSPREHATSAIVARLLVVVPALVFLGAGVAKAADPSGVAAVIDHFGAGAAIDLIVPALVALEVMLGLALLLWPEARCRWVGAGVLAALTGVLVLLLISQDPPACGCLGVIELHTSTRAQLGYALARNMVLIGLLIYPASRAAKPA